MAGDLGQATSTSGKGEEEEREHRLSKRCGRLNHRIVGGVTRGAREFNRNRR